MQGYSKVKEYIAAQGMAKHIKGHNKVNHLIPCTGPMPSSLSDFWRMIWEYKLPTVVMLTKCKEAGRVRRINFITLLEQFITGY